MNSTHTIALCGPSSGASADYTLTLPPVVGGVGDLPYNNGSGTLLWKPSGVAVNAAAGASGETLTTSTSDFRIYSPTAAITVKLNNSFFAGRRLEIHNAGTGFDDIITLTANDDSVIRRIYPGTTGVVRCNTDAPADNTDWTGISPIISNAMDVSTLVSFTGIGTPADIEVLMTRRGSKAKFEGWTEAGTVAATIMTMILPTGIVINSSAPYESAHHHFGMWSSHRASSWLAAGDGGVVTYISGQGTDRVCFARDGNADAWNTMLANAVLANSSTFSFNFEFEVVGWGAFNG